MVHWRSYILACSGLIGALTGGFWQFTSDLAIKDSAYTQLALSAHTDTAYFTDPVGLHSFHLLSHTNGEGGASLLVDGFTAAQVLRMESPESFDALCRIKVRWHSSGNEGVNIMPDRSFPVLTLEDSQPGQETKVSQVRWNNDDRAAIHADDPKDVAQFYAAARKWVEILQRPSCQYWHQLRPGTFVGSYDLSFLCIPRKKAYKQHQYSTTGEYCMADRHSQAKDTCVVVTVSVDPFLFAFFHPVEI